MADQYLTAHQPTNRIDRLMALNRAENRKTTMADNGLPTDLPACLYVGKVMHQRLKPVGHRFSYSVFSLMIDLDQLTGASRQSSIFSVNASNIVSFHEADHLPDSESNLRSYADKLLADAGLEKPAARLVLVCYPRIFGYVFNPISVYYAYNDENQLIALIYEVRNTFKQRHTYVCRIEDGELSAAGIRQERSKIFYVSPFVQMDMKYQFRMLPPGRSIRWRILETDGEGPLLSASFHGHEKPLSTRSLTTCLLRIPLLTWKITFGIHWEALKLWMKGVRLVDRPAPPPPVSFRDEAGFGQPGE